MPIHRRRFLRLCGVAGLGAVAGCSGGSQDGGTPADDDTPADSETTTQSPTATLTPIETTDPLEQKDKIVAEDGDSADSFGTALALSRDGTTAVIGAWSDEDPNGADQVTIGETQYNVGAGSAYVFGNSGGSWSQQAKLAADDGDGSDFFGHSVTLSNDGTTVVIGAPGDEDPNGERGGSAYVFENSGEAWTQRSKLVADDAGRYDHFGDWVALSGDGTIALVGAPVWPSIDDSGGDGPGSAYPFNL